jgi:hypothetical protein
MGNVVFEDGEKWTEEQLEERLIQARTNGYNAGYEACAKRAYGIARVAAEDLFMRQASCSANDLRTLALNLGKLTPDITTANLSG